MHFLFCLCSLKNLKFVSSEIDQAVFLHSGHLGDHSAAAHAQIIGELLAVIGNRKTQRSGLTDEAVKESKELFAGGALGDDFQFLIEKDIAETESILTAG